MAVSNGATTDFSRGLNRSLNERDETCEKFGRYWSTDIIVLTSIGRGLTAANAMTVAMIFLTSSTGVSNVELNFVIDVDSVGTDKRRVLWGERNTRMTNCV